MGEASWRAFEGQTAQISNTNAQYPSGKYLLSTQQNGWTPSVSRSNNGFSNSTALCFTETWLNDAILDSALHLSSFQLFRSGRNTESTGKSCGGGTCFYINERWGKDVTVLKEMCCSDLEALFINCKPFYLPQEFCSFVLMSVYIPLQAHVSLA